MPKLQSNRIFVLLLILSALIGCSATQTEPEAPTNSQTVKMGDEVAVAATVASATKTPPPTATIEPTIAPLEPAATDTPTVSAETFKSDLPILQVAPNITNETWINSDPLTLEALRGKVVLIEFWTFG